MRKEITDKDEDIIRVIIIGLYFLRNAKYIATLIKTTRASEPNKPTNLLTNASGVSAI